MLARGVHAARVQTVPLTVIESVPDALWLPRGGRADVVLDLGGPAPTPTGLVRLLVLSGRNIFCVPRDNSSNLDLPTRAVPQLDDGRATALRLALDILGGPAEITLVGYVRNVVEQAGANYPWPTPSAHFTVWAANGEPQVAGTWLALDDADSPLRNRHWWALMPHETERG